MAKLRVVSRLDSSFDFPKFTVSGLVQIHGGGFYLVILQVRDSKETKVNEALRRMIEK